MLWGYQNGWFDFLDDTTDPIYPKLRFLLKHGLGDTAVGIEHIASLDDDKLRDLGKYLADHDLHITPDVWFDYVNADANAAKASQQRIIDALRRCAPILRSWIVVTHAGAGHRFDRILPVEEKLARLSRGLAPISAACHGLGTPLGINNQGDFYMGDFIELCRRTPHLYLQVDTANIFWAGEPIFPAMAMAAPLTVGTHFRDELITIGNRQPRGVMLGNCATGDGDVDLRSCYQVLKEQAPWPDRLVMQIEMFGPRDRPQAESLARSLDFVRSLRGV